MALSANTKEQREEARKALLDIAKPNASATTDERIRAAAILLQDITIEEASL